MANKYCKIVSRSGNKTTSVQDKDGKFVCRISTNVSKKTTVRVALGDGGSVVTLDGRKARSLFLALKKHYAF